MRKIAILFNRIANYCESRYHHGCGSGGGCSSSSISTYPSSGCGGGNPCG